MSDGMTNLIEDLRYGFRLLRKSPVFTAVAITTLALGIGANTAIYTLLDQALLRPLPVKDPSQLMVLRHTGRDPGYSRTSTFEDLFYSYPMYRDLRDQNSVFSGVIATYWPAQVGMRWHNEPELAEAELVSGNYFDVLGVQAAIGRLFVPSDDIAQEAHPVAVLSFDYWVRRFGADPHITNQTVSINGHPFTVIGVAAPGFHSIVSQNSPALFAPMMMKPEITPGWNDLEERQSYWLNIIGRLKPGLTQDKAQAGIDPLWQSIRAEELKLQGHSSQRFKDSFLTNSHLFLVEGSKGVPRSGSTPTTLLVIMGMAVLMALMACTNVGSLLLVRVASRSRETAVRYALGSDRGRLIAQLLAEGIFLGLGGGILGIALAPEIAKVLIQTMWANDRVNVTPSSHPDLRVLAFNFAVALVVSVLFSLAPALQFWRPNAIDALKQQSNAVAGGPLRLRRASVIAQIGVSLLLLTGAGLFVRTLHNLKLVDVGFSTDHLLTFTIDPQLAGYQPDQKLALHRQILDRLAGLPGVRSVAATSDPELRNNNETANVTVAGYQATENEDMNVEHSLVISNYFATLKMPLLAGREINDQDRVESQKVAVVNESFAKRYFGRPQKAIGGYFCFGAGDFKPDIEIIGVVADAKHTTVRSDIHRAVFTPYLQDPNKTSSSPMTFYVRTWQAPDSAESTIRGATSQLDSKLVLDEFRTMQEQVETNLGDERVIALLATSFGLLAALMAAIGIYGVLAYSISQRTREIGVRVAMGATRAVLIQMVLRDVLTLTIIGIAVGIPPSLLLAHVARAQLFGVSQSDPLTLVCVSLIVLTVATAAAAIPAYRATRVDPIVALRYE